MEKQDSLDQNCLFCQWVAEHNPVETLRTVAAFNDGYPVTKGHLLILPLRHTIDGFSMTEQELRDSGQLIRILTDKIKITDTSVTADFPHPFSQVITNYLTRIK